jgi:hypothetical protein
MKALSFCFILFFLGSKGAYAQTGNIQWQRSLGGSGLDRGYKCIPTPDNGFFVVGVTESNDGDIINLIGSGDVWIVKLDSSGTIQWSKTIGGSQGEYANSFDVTIDGGFIIGGTTGSNDIDVSGNQGESDYWIVKLDSAGNIEWQKCYGGSDWEGLYDIQQTADSGYIVAGESSSADGDVVGQHSCHGCDPDFWILKLDPLGNIQWQRCLGGIFRESPTGLTQTSDGGYIIGGVAIINNGDVSGCHGHFDYWIVKLDSSGNLLWQRCIGGSSNDAANAVISTSDGGCLVFGEASSIDGDVSNNYGSWDAWLVKLDTLGNIEWDKNYGGSNSESGKALAQYNDSAIYLLSFSQSFDGDVSGNHGMGDFWLTKTDINGNLLWEKCYGGSNTDMPTSVYVINDYELIMTGYSKSSDGDLSFNHGGNCNGFVCDDLWVVKINDTPVSVQEISAEESIHIYPNPFQHSIHISSTAVLNGNIKIFNALGDIVSTLPVKENLSIDLNHLSEGIYFLEYRDEQRSMVRKITKVN